MLVVGAWPALGLAGLLPSLFVMVSSVGLVLPNATALALADHPRTAGSASALLGLTQFATGALAAPLAGVGGSHTALPMAIVMATLPLAGLACLFGLAGRRRPGGGNDRTRGLTALSARARRPTCRPCARAGA